MKLARVASGRNATVSIEGSYHGHGFGAFGLSRARPDARLGGFLADRLHVSPYWNAAGGGAEAMLDGIRTALATAPGGVTAVVAEPIRSNCHVPPPGLWPEVRRLCDSPGALLVFDEIPSGLGKTGRFFAFQHFGVVPDMVVLGKALGGGILPIAAVLADARLNVAPDLSLGHYTHEKNPMITRAALTTVGIILREGLAARATRLEQRVRERAAELAQEHPALAGVRGKGLLLAIELAPDRLTSRGGAEAAAALERALLAQGISTTLKGPAAISFSPPLNVREEELDLALARISAAVAGLERDDSRASSGLR